MGDTYLTRVLRERYRLDAVIGEGGMGVVYRGYDLMIERPVAVKLLRGQTNRDADEVHRMMREMRATAKVKSAHSVTLFDVGETDEGEPFLVMNLIDGESLQARLAREKRMPVARAVAMAVQVCDALEAAHAVGIVHRDVKPANIMLTSTGTEDVVTVVDFGIAKRLDQATALTGAGALVGTVQYMAPEQIAGDAIDGRADQYALAATLLRTLSGAPLFPDDAGVAAVIHNQLLKVPVPLGERLPSAPLALDAALRKALEKNPSARYPDIAAFASALRAALTPGVSPPPARSAPGPEAATVAGGRVFGAEALVPLESGAGDLELEVDVPVQPVPPPPHVALPMLAIAPRRASASVVRVQHEVSAPASWLSPNIWKRVFGYCALALILGKGCMPSLLSREWTIALVAGVVLGAAALGVHAWSTRDRT